MKKLILPLATLILIFSACTNIPFGSGIKGEGPIEKTERTVSDFKGVELLASADVNIKQGSAFKVTVEGQKNITNELETVVENGSLKIRFKNTIVNLQYDKLVVYVEAPTFDKLILAGSGNMTVENAFSSTTPVTIDITGSGNLVAQSTVTSPELNIDVSGSGNLTIKDAQSAKIATNLVGSGNIHLTGKVNDSNYEVSGSGDIDGSDLKAQNVKASITGSGNIKCHAEATLEANVSGSGDIIYSGTPLSKISYHRQWRSFCKELNSFDDSI